MGCGGAGAVWLAVVVLVVSVVLLGRREKKLKRSMFAPKGSRRELHF